jgi:hypothetical protein
LISTLGKKEGEEDDPTLYLVACLKARMVKDGVLGSMRRKKELNAVGCPKPEHGIVAGWSCKFADGHWHAL